MGWQYAAAEAALQRPQYFKIGMLAEHPLRPVSSSVKRALSMSRKILEDHGFQVVDIALPDHFWQRSSFFMNVMIRNGYMFH